jgi:hypothetical protein
MCDTSQHPRESSKLAVCTRTICTVHPWWNEGMGARVFVKKVKSQAHYGHVLGTMRLA